MLWNVEKAIFFHINKASTVIHVAKTVNSGRGEQVSQMRNRK